MLCLSLEILCPDLTYPENGQVVMSGMTPGDTAMYSCNVGFELVGADTVTCGSDGVWSVGPPVCIRELFHIFVLVIRILC